MAWVARQSGHLHLVDRILKVATAPDRWPAAAAQDLQLTASMRGVALTDGRK